MADQGNVGHFGVTDSNSPFNHHDFHIDQKLARVRTMTPVKIIDVTQISPSQFSVDVQPQINMVDGLGNSTPHDTIYDIPMANGSGGNGGVLVKPKVGDIGMMGVSDRDMSSVIKAGAAANPGSGRRHDLSDGVYLGGFGSMNGTPSQHIVLTENGIEFQGNLIVTGTITASGEITGNGIKLTKHTHGGGPEPDAGS